MGEFTKVLAEGFLIGQRALGVLENLADFQRYRLDNGAVMPLGLFGESHPERNGPSGQS